MTENRCSTITDADTCSRCGAAGDCAEKLLGAHKRAPGRCAHNESAHTGDNDECIVCGCGGFTA
jgi:hypothetical protein